jgi:hypothetical protein
MGSWVIKGRSPWDNLLIYISVALKRVKITCLNCSICQRCPYECESIALVSSCISPECWILLANPISIRHSWKASQYMRIGFMLGSLTGISISIWHFVNPASSFNVKTRRCIFSLFSHARAAPGKGLNCS